MSDELAQDEEDAEDYDLDTIGPRRVKHVAIGDTHIIGQSRESIADDGVVFEIGDEDEMDSDDEHENAHDRDRRRPLDDRQVGNEHDDERAGLMGEGGRRVKDRSD